MTPETVTFPSQAEIEQAILRARQMRAEMISSGLRRALRATAHWIAHPSLHPQHA